MKKWISICLIIAGMAVKAQTLEHTYNSPVYYSKVGDNAAVYFTYSSATKTCDIYSMDHSLIKSVVLKINEPNATVLNVSKLLINNTADFELIALGASIYVISENGDVIKTIPAAPSSSSLYGFLQNTINGPKLIAVSTLQSSGNVYSVYSLSGTLYLGKKEIEEQEGFTSAYPNPANDFVIIPISNDADKVTVFNSEGKMVKEYNGNAGQIDIKMYPTGMYYYNINEKYAGKFVKE